MIEVTKKEVSTREVAARFNELAQQEKWFEIQDETNYFEKFEKEKIVWSKLSDKPKFALDTEGYYLANTTLFMVGKNLKFLLAILNSKLSEWYFNLIATTTGMGTNEWINVKVGQLPIKDIPEAEQKPIIEKVEKILAIKKATPSVSTVELEGEIDKLVYGLYGLTEEEISIIENSIK